MKFFNKIQKFLKKKKVCGRKSYYLVMRKSYYLVILAAGITSCFPSLSSAQDQSTANMLRGKGFANSGTASAFTGLTAQGAGTFIYITGIQCLRADASPTSIVIVTLNDTAATVIGVPTTGVSFVVYGRVPLIMPANTGLTLALNTSVTNGVTCTAQGYRG
jgi:hypothetical protein